MKARKKSLVAGVVALFLSTSCCWISALATWLGGATILVVIGIKLESIQIPLLLFGIALITIAVISYLKTGKSLK